MIDVIRYKVINFNTDMLYVPEEADLEVCFQAVVARFLPHLAFLVSLAKPCQAF